MKKIILVILFSLYSTISTAKSLNTYIEEADNGNSTSAFKLGMIYEFGIEDKVNIDISKAIQYYTLAAEEDNYKAISRLGVIYYNRADYSKSISYLKLGATKEEALSEAYLGKILEERADKPEAAVKFYESSAKKNNPYGKMFLGEFYIKNEKRGSLKFLKGYALLVSASKLNIEAKDFIRRNPYTFSEEDKEILKNEILNLR
jgi:hypothetical protein